MSIKFDHIPSQTYRDLLYRTSKDEPHCIKRWGANFKVACRHLAYFFKHGRFETPRSLANHLIAHVRNDAFSAKNKMDQAKLDLLQQTFKEVHGHLKSARVQHKKQKKLEQTISIVKNQDAKSSKSVSEATEVASTVSTPVHTFPQLQELHKHIEKALQFAKELDTAFKARDIVHSGVLLYDAKDIRNWKTGLAHPLENAKDPASSNALDWKKVVDKFREIEHYLYAPFSKDDTPKQLLEIFTNMAEQINKILPCVAEAFYLKGDSTSAISIITGIYFDTKATDAFMLRLAENDYLNGNLDMACITVTMGVQDEQLKEAFLAKLADAYYTKKQYDNALSTVEKFIFDTKTQEAFFAKLAEAYHKLGARDKALATIKSIRFDTKTRDDFLKKIS